MTRGWPGRRRVPGTCVKGGQAAQRPRLAGETPNSVSDGSHDTPFVEMFHRRGEAPAGVVARRSWIPGGGPHVGVGAPDRGRSGPRDWASLGLRPQNPHSLCTADAQAGGVVHTMWRPSSLGPPLRCRAVSQTPAYDQLRGERINADAPASDADPQIDHPGKHRLRDDPPGAGAVFSPLTGPGADLGRGWSGFWAGDSERPGKHRIRDDPLDLASRMQ